MKKKLISFFKRIHHSIPPDFQIIYMFFINILRKFKYCILPVYLYKGNEKTGGQPLNIVYIGWDIRICNYWTNRLMDKSLLVEKKGMIPVWKVHNHLNINKVLYDMAIVEMNNLTKIFARRNTGFLIPRWFEMQIDNKDGIIKVRKKDIKRRIRKYSLTFKKDFSKSDIKFFYERMFIPFISKRHGDNAVLCDYAYFLNKFKKKGSRLNFILKDGKPIAGSFTELIGKTLRLTGVGIIDGREDILKMGVIGAIYYFEMLHANEEGVKSINVGGTSPILTEGLTKFKLSLGSKAADIKYFIDLSLWFAPLKDSSALINCLKSNPFIHRVKNNLYRTIFIDQLDYDDKSEFYTLIKHTNCCNLKGTMVFCIGDHDKINEWIKEEGLQDFQVLDYKVS